MVYLPERCNNKQFHIQNKKSLIICKHWGLSILNFNTESQRSPKSNNIATKFSAFIITERDRMYKSITIHIERKLTFYNHTYMMTNLKQNKHVLCAHTREK